MDIKLNLNKSIEQNAEVYYDKAKKFKKKIPGIKKTIDLYEAKLAKVEHGLLEIENNKLKKTVKAKKEWFDKFRWFISSDNFLVVGGRDATTNDIIIKKYLDANDIVFHTELAGSPFVIIKNSDNTKIPETTLSEAAEFCASFSKSWRSGRSTAEVYHVNPDQVSKEAKSGEYVSKGAFMIYGKRNFVNAPLNTAICNHEGKIMSGPVSAVKKYCVENKQEYVEIIAGNDKLSDVAKKIRKIIGGDLDEIIRALPSECTIKKTK